MAAKPHRTADRILVCTLELLNLHGEPNVSTTLISAELGISPGNLYYHFPARDELINALVGRHLVELAPLLAAAADVRNVEDAWLYFHMQFELIWRYRFLYRDMNDLLSKNRRLEGELQRMVTAQEQAMLDLLAGLARGGALHASGDECQALAPAMLVLLNYWLSFEYVRDPRHALEPERVEAALLRGAFHVLNLLTPYLEPASRTHLQGLTASYAQAGGPGKAR
ncbi:MAG TPA: TetR/AcrR family transcriptional regulator [Burkholderiaceae bacterium]